MTKSINDVCNILAGKKKYTGKSKVLFATLPIILMSHSSLFAGESGKAENRVSVFDEIVVTAQKREQNLQDVSVSVTAMTGEALQTLGYSSAKDISAQVPGVTIADVAGGNNNIMISIRGASQSDFGDQNEAPNATYVDEGYISAMGALGFAIFDLERVEVLRGPQGTLFGRNATGGLIHYITRKPKAGLDGYFRAGYADYNQVKLEGAVGGGNDKISGRLSGSFEDSDGWVRNRIGKNLQAVNNYAIRAQLLFNPTDKLEIWLKGQQSEANDTPGAAWAHHAGTRGINGLTRFVRPDELANFQGAFGTFQTCGGCDAFGYKDTDGDPNTVDIDRQDTGVISDSQTGTVRITWTGNDFTLTSISNFLSFDRRFGTDGDASPTPALVFTPTVAMDQYSQELRINGEGERYRWVVGTYYLNIKADFTTDLDALFPTGVPDDTYFKGGFGGLPFGFRNVADQKTESYAFFGQGEYDISEDITLTVGGRWTEDKKSFNYKNTSLGILAANPVRVFHGKISKGDYSLRVGIDYRVNEDILTYANVSRGIKGGGFNSPLDGGLPDDRMAYGQETIWTYEVGAKATLFDGLARLNVSSFYSDYNDFQAFAFVGLTSVTTNRDAEMYGAEIELKANPSEGLDIGLGISLLEAKVFGVNLPDGSIATRRSSQAPKFTLNGFIRQQWDLVNGGIVSAQFDMNYSSSQFYSVLNSPSLLEGGYSVGNIVIGYTTPDDNWSIDFFVRNLWNEKYGTFGFDVTAPSGSTVTGISPPRWVGGAIKYRFGE